MKYLKSNASYTSIFRLTNNSISEGDTCSTSDIIYLEVPFRLYCFGKSIGEDRFIQVISEIYSKKYIDLVVFEKLLHKAGILNSEWISLVQSL